MASKTAARKPVEVVLDPTKITTWKLVRQPPQVPGKLIQGLPRERNSSAMKEHRAREGVRLRKALNAMTHGKNIFAYHHIRTKQVVYSLTRYLEVSRQQSTRDKPADQSSIADAKCATGK